MTGINAPVRIGITPRSLLQDDYSHKNMVIGIAIDHIFDY